MNLCIGGPRASLIGLAASHIVAFALCIAFHATTWAGVHVSAAVCVCFCFFGPSARRWRFSRFVGLFLHWCVCFVVLVPSARADGGTSRKIFKTNFAKVQPDLGEIGARTCNWFVFLIVVVVLVLKLRCNVIDFVGIGLGFSFRFEGDFSPPQQILQQLFRFLQLL